MRPSFRSRLWPASLSCDTLVCLLMARNHLQRIVLIARPRGAPKPEDFQLEEARIPDPQPGEVTRRVLYLPWIPTSGAGWMIVPRTLPPWLRAR